MQTSLDRAAPLLQKINSSRRITIRRRRWMGCSRWLQQVDRCVTLPMHQPALPLGVEMVVPMTYAETAAPGVVPL